MTLPSTGFLIASLVLAATPGPGVLYIVTRTLTQGRAAGLASVAGVALGNFGNAAAAVAGLATLFALSATAFTVVKLAGAGYLVWLGLRAWRRPPEGAHVAQQHAPQQDAAPTLALTRAFGEGALVALLNPKTLLFFAAGLVAPVVQRHGVDPCPSSTREPE